ncbi:cytochrome-450 hydroxylase [Calocera viscosa TUFC12733]|uniref:Cytochrome-450 hydroxylase n=1 Tax=Calocera viscosa (strain TUFC12733) TaxID=1330018 RepID=A0A167R8C3_CALVF|nr:cytochrome-450 hydroxylase [Calocera viscosa TUFC12733]
MIAPVLIVFGCLCLMYCIWWLWTVVIYHLLFSPIQQLPGPESDGFFATQLRNIMEPEISPMFHDEWVSKYGKTFRVYGFGKFDPRILSLDPLAMSHVLNYPNIYPKPWQSRSLISELIGNGLFSAEGLPHRRQRKVLNPAFSNQNLQALAPIFTSKAIQICRTWTDILGHADEVCVDVSHWMSRATFDVIGLAGFDYEFNALEGESNPVYVAYREMFQVGLDEGFTARSILEVYLPFLKSFWPDQRTKTIKRSHEIIYGIGRELLKRKKQEVDTAPASPQGPKDLLTLMIRSNLSSGITKDQRISDREMLDEINSFFFAGSDSTSLALSWALYLLAVNPDTQERLRKELTSLDDDVALGEIDALPFLDKVCKEELRLIPPVHSSLRVAEREDVLPLSSPVTLRNGSTVTQLRVPKGTCVHVPVEGFNLLTEVWGPDAHRFNPDRWDDLPPAARAQPGLYSNIMTFSAGPRACIGVRFSIIEMKIFLFHLIRSFEFVSRERIIKHNVVLTRPFVRGRRKSQLPLIIRRVS